MDYKKIVPKKGATSIGRKKTIDYSKIKLAKLLEPTVTRTPTYSSPDEGALYNYSLNQYINERGQREQAERSQIAAERMAATKSAYYTAFVQNRANKYKTSAGDINWRVYGEANALPFNEAAPLMARGAVAGTIGIGKSLLGTVQSIGDAMRLDSEAQRKYTEYAGADNEKQELAKASNAEQMKALSSWANEKGRIVQDYIDNNWGASADWNEAQKFMYNLGAAIPSIGASLMLTGILHSSSVAAALFGVIQQGSKYQEYRTAGRSVNDSLLLSGAAGIVEGVLEKAFLDKWMTMPNSTVMRRLVLRSLNEGLQEASQSMGGYAMDTIAYKKNPVLWRNLGPALGQALYEGLIGAIVGVPAAVTMGVSENNGYKYIRDKMVENGIPAKIAAEAAQHIQNKLLSEGERLAKMKPEERAEEEQKVVNEEINLQAEKVSPELKGANAVLKEAIGLVGGDKTLPVIGVFGILQNGVTLSLQAGQNEALEALPDMMRINFGPRFFDLGPDTRAILLERELAKFTPEAIDQAKQFQPLPDSVEAGIAQRKAERLAEHKVEPVVIAPAAKQVAARESQNVVRPERTADDIIDEMVGVNPGEKGAELVPGELDNIMVNDGAPKVDVVAIKRDAQGDAIYNPGNVVAQDIAAIAEAKAVDGHFNDKDFNAMLLDLGRLKFMESPTEIMEATGLDESNAKYRAKVNIAHNQMVDKAIDRVKQAHNKVWEKEAPKAHRAETPDAGDIPFNPGNGKDQFMQPDGAIYHFDKDGYRLYDRTKNVTYTNGGTDVGFEVGDVVRPAIGHSMFGDIKAEFLPLGIGGEGDFEIVVSEVLGPEAVHYSYMPAERIIGNRVKNVLDIDLAIQAKMAGKVLLEPNTAEKILAGKIEEAAKPAKAEYKAPWPWDAKGFPKGLGYDDRGKGKAQPHIFGFLDYVDGCAPIPHRPDVPQEGRFMALLLDDGRVVIGAESTLKPNDWIKHNHWYNRAVYYVKLALEKKIPFGRIARAGVLDDGIFLASPAPYGKEIGNIGRKRAAVRYLHLQDLWMNKKVKGPGRVLRREAEISHEELMEIINQYIEAHPGKTVNDWMVSPYEYTPPWDRDWVVCGIEGQPDHYIPRNLKPANGVKKAPANPKKQPAKRIDGEGDAKDYVAEDMGISPRGVPLYDPGLAVALQKDDGSPLRVDDERFIPVEAPRDGLNGQREIAFGHIQNVVNDNGLEAWIDGIPPGFMNFKQYLEKETHLPGLSPVIDVKPMDVTNLLGHRVVMDILGGIHYGHRNHTSLMGDLDLPSWMVAYGSHLFEGGQSVEEWAKTHSTGAHIFSAKGRYLEAQRWAGIVKHTQQLLAKHPEWGLTMPADVLSDLKLIETRLGLNDGILPGFDYLDGLGNTVEIDGEKRAFIELHLNNGRAAPLTYEQAISDGVSPGEAKKAAKINAQQIAIMEAWPVVSEWAGLSDRMTPIPINLVGAGTAVAVERNINGEEIQMKLEAIKAVKNELARRNLIPETVRVMGIEAVAQRRGVEENIGDREAIALYVYPELMKMKEELARQWPERSARLEEDAAKLPPPELPPQFNEADKVRAARKSLKIDLLNGGATLTAYAPFDDDFKGLDPAIQQKKLEKELREGVDGKHGGYSPIPAIGKYEGDGSETPSFFVPGMTIEDAEYYRDRYGQETVLISGGLLYANGFVRPVNYKEIVHGAVVNEEAVIDIYAEGETEYDAKTNGYTILEYNGIKFKFVYDFDWNPSNLMEATEAQQKILSFAQRNFLNRPGFFSLRMLLPGEGWTGKAKDYLIETPGGLSREHLLDDVWNIRDMMWNYGGNADILNIRMAVVDMVNFINNGVAPLPDGKGNVEAPGERLLPFYVIGDRLKAAGKTFAQAERFARIYVATLGRPVNLNAEPSINLKLQGGNVAKVVANARALMEQYSKEDIAVFKEFMDSVRAYIKPLVTKMVMKGMIDTEGLSVDNFIDRYVSLAPIDAKFDFSSPLKAADIENVSKDKVIGFMDGIFNSMLHLYKALYFNEFVQKFSTTYGFDTDKATSMSYYDDTGKKIYVAAPAHILRQLGAVIKRNGPELAILKSNWYRRAMFASRQLKIFTPNFAMTNLPRDATMAFFRFGIHPGTILETLVNVFGGKSKKAAGQTWLALGDIGPTIPKTNLRKILQYLRDDVLGFSEAFMRNYAMNVERHLGGSQADQHAALLGGTTDFSVHGSSGGVMNIEALLQFSKASLNVAQSWNTGWRELISDFSSPDRGTRLNAVNRALYMIAFVAAGIVFKEREREKKELQDYVYQNKIPIRIGDKILAIPEGFNTGAYLESAIATVIAGIRDGDPMWKINKTLAEDTFAGIMGYIGRDGDPGIRSLISTMTPTLLEPLARAIFNVSYGGRSIDAFTFGKKYTHYYDNTSEVAKKFASKLHAKFPGIDISPITLEYLFKSYLGRYGNAIAMADDAATPGVWSGMGNALAYFAKQPYFSAIPTGFQTQMYQDFKGYYKNIEGDLSAVKAGKLKVSNDMINDLFDLENVHKVLGKVTDPNDIFALSIYGMQIYETYVKDAAAFKP